MGAFFWDRHESLLFSLKLGMKAEPVVRMNLYPGALDLGGAQIGSFLWASPHDGVAGGITFAVSPIGLALQGGGTKERQTF